MQRQSRPAYQFGAFRLDVAERRLQQRGRALPLTPKVFDVLRVLVQNHGHLVEKGQLLAEVWPDSYIEEGALSRSVSIIRKTLGDDGSESQYIETIPKRGYRFIAPVTELDASRRFAKPAAWLAAAVALLLIAGAMVWLATADRETRATVANSRSAAPVHRQATFTGKERAPAISPDGRHLAYVSYETPDRKLVVQNLEGGPALTIFTAPEIGYVRWSPNWTELLVWTRGDGRNGVYVLPQTGGTPRRIAPGQFIACWSPDGSTIAVASYLNGRIWFFDTSGKLQRTIVLRDVNGSISDIDWSAHGALTLVSGDTRGRYSLWTASLTAVTSDGWSIPLPRCRRHAGLRGDTRSTSSAG